jgi:cell division protein FtsW (lipid II flippase)
VPYGRRWASSLFLLVFALLVAISAFAQVGLARDGTLPTGMFGYGAAIIFLAGVAYVVVQRWAPYADPLLLPLAVFLNGIGLAIIYRIDQTTAADYAKNKASYLAAHPGGHYVPFGAGASATTQLLWTTLSISLFIAFVLLVRDVKLLSKYTYILGISGLIFLVMPVFFPAVNGAKVWITVPGVGSVQPAEFSKFALVTFFAGYLAKNGPAMSVVGRKIGPIDLPRARHIMPIVVIWLVSIMILVLQNDFGFQLLFFGLLICMLYIGTGRGGYVVIGIVLFVVGCLGVYFLALAVGGPLEHLLQRVEIWMDPYAYFDGGCQLPNGTVVRQWAENPQHLGVGPDGNFHPQAACTALKGHYSDSSQLVQGMFAFGQGGVLGTGLGQGQPYLTPLAFSDEIGASIGEELGLTGLMAILLVYALLVQRGFKIATGCRDAFSKLFAGGISFVFALQVFVIIGGVSRLIPFAGITTPFMAQGGSSLLANWILIAILIRLSDQARRPAPQAIQDEGMTQIVSLR